MSTTLLALETLIAKELGYAGGTPTAGATTTVTDTSSDSPFSTGDSSQLFQNAWVRIESDSAGTPRNVGDIRRITTYTPSNQQVTHDAFDYTNATTMTYGVHMGLPPTRVGLDKGLLEYINEVLRNTMYRNKLLLTLVTDGDMETSGVTNWTDATSGGTVAKSTATGITLGKQSLAITAGAANGYARTANIDVTSGQRYHVAVDVMCAGTEAQLGATLEVYDATNSASVGTVSSGAHARSQRYLWLNFTVPSTCSNIQVRLRGDTASGTNYWDNLSLRQLNNKEANLPSWFVNPHWAEELYYWGGGTTASSGSDRAADERTYTRMNWWRIVQDHTGLTPYKIQYSPDPPPGSHLFLECIRPYDEMSALTGTTDADQDLIKSWVLARVYADRDKKELAQRWLLEAQLLHRRHHPVVRRRIQLGEPF